MNIPTIKTGRDTSAKSTKCGLDCRNLLSALLQRESFFFPGERLSMTPKQSLFQRCLAILSAALLSAALVMVGTWLPAGATGTHGEGGDRDDAEALQIVLITDHGSGLQWPVQDRQFDVVVQVVDDDGKPTKVDKATKIKLMEVLGPGELGGNTTAVIQAGFSSTTIYGATYSQFANGVMLKVKVVYGDAPGAGQDHRGGRSHGRRRRCQARHAVDTQGSKLCRSNREVPNCGIFVLKNGADGHVTLSVGSCDGLVNRFGGCREGGDTEALVVTAIASLKDSDGDSLYSRKHPAKVILACDKALCPKNGDKTYGKNDHKKLKMSALHPEQHRSAEEGRATVPEEGCTWQGPRGMRRLQEQQAARRRPLLARPLQGRCSLERVAQRRTQAAAPGRRPATRGLRPGVSVLRGGPRGPVSLTR